MNLICPECKNEVALSFYSTVAAGHVIECDMCGITLQVIEISPAGQVTAEIIDEGK